VKRSSILAAAIAIGTAAAALAHVTPNVSLVARGDFLKESLPGSTKYFRKSLRLGREQVARIRAETRWSPSEEDARVYVGRDANGQLVGTVAFLWVPSQHGPVGIAAAFDDSGRLIRATVTDAGSEPIVWIRPLLNSGRLPSLEGLEIDQKPDPGKIAPSVRAPMPRYYATVIASGIERAQALERVALEEKER
jgi:hypothetical protein